MAAIKLFGRIADRPVYIIKLANEKMEAEFLSFGATVHSIRIPDKTGAMRDVCLGYDCIEEYMNNDGYIGATVGRHANRIGGSRFYLNGKEHILSANEGKNQLHGGIEGFSHKCWSFSCTENSVCFSIDSPDGDEGFPGNLHAEVCFSIEGSTLRLDYSAKSDADTVVNLTNHTYFNLGGQQSGSVGSHTLKLGADRYTVCSNDNIPTGEIAPVDGTALDFRSDRTIADSLMLLNNTPTEGIDHNFVLSESPAASLCCPESGIELVCRTSLEGVQVYSAGFLTERAGKDGAVYNKHHGLCLETQRFPDAINKPNFPSPVLKAGEEYREWTEYSFNIR